MEIVIYPDPRLRAETEAIKDFGPDLEDLGKEMLEFMYKKKGVGLAGPQVGILKKIIVVNPTGEPGENEHELVLINPKIIESAGQETGEEGCLSFPGIFGEVTRPKTIKVKAWDPKGEEFVLDASGFLGRVLQHEMDHLDGILFIDRMTPAQKLKIRKQLKKLVKEQKA